MAARRKHEVRYLPAAEGDLLELYRWILEDSASRAEAFLADLDKRIGTLARHPELGRVPRNPKLREAGYRVLTVESYLIFYVVRGRLVEIHCAIHGSRNLDEVL